MAYFRGFLIILLSLFFASCTFIDGDVDTSIVDQICNGGRFAMLDFFTLQAMKTVVETVVEETSKAEMLDYYTGNTVAGVYAHGVCTRTLSSDECAYCMKSAYQQLLVNCSTQHIGAQINLRDCRLRYEIYLFRNDD